MGRIDAEKAQQAAAARTRAGKKTNESRTRKRAAVRMQRLRDELEAERERAALIDTRKSAARRSHQTMRGIIAQQLGIRDAGRLASGRVGAVVKAFGAYRPDGKSLNLRPASRRTIGRWLWKRYLANLILESKEISELLATGKDVAWVLAQI